MREIAIERINILFNQADNVFHEHPDRSKNYVKMARKISKKYNTKIPQKWNKRFCKNCYTFLKYGKNSKVRLVNSKIHITCLECGSIMKVPYIKEIKKKRREKIESQIIKKRDNE